MPNDLLDRVRTHVVTKFDADVVAHDFHHMERVEVNALQLARSEGADPLVVCLAALLHDYHRFHEAALGRHVSPEEAQPQVNAVLRDFGAGEDLIAQVAECIAFTERYFCAGDDIDLSGYSIEAKVVRDADMLDALGAVGIARAFMFGGRLGQPMWSPMPVNQQFAHGRTHSVVHHFHEKLFQLTQEMLTPQGKAMAAQRTRYMEEFISRLMQEINA
ncbi:MAG: HD domain-containing protein [Comamonas sp.]